jgi:protein-S-isoprenylcysteine O-methyltransferase Ste14
MKWQYVKNKIFNDHYASCVGALFFTFWIGQRVYFYYEQLFQLSLYAFIWWLITFQFFLFVISYMTRTKARVHASGFIESVFPFICAAMPFALLIEYPIMPPTYGIATLKSLSILLVIGGTLLIITGVLFLRKSFSIMTEVREPVFNGIYRITRHPMYVGSIMTTLGTLFQRFGLLNCFLFIVFLVCLVYRAIREENKMMIHSSEYRTYASEVGWVWKFGRRKSLSRMINTIEE